MRASLVLMLCTLVITACIDWYILSQIRRRVHRHRRFWFNVELWSSIVLVLTMIAGIAVPMGTGSNHVLLAKMWLIFTFLSVLIPKAVAVIFDLLASIPRLFGHPRIRIITVIGIVVAAVIFGAMWWGALINRYRIDVKEVTVEITDLPAHFDGYRIVQLSDLHTGTFNADTTFVSEIVDRTNSLNADAIVFTGDIVNRQSDEILPFVPVLSRLSAPDGVFAIMGNHDYGDYRNWPAPQAKHDNLQTLVDAYRRTGIRLLLNETVMLRHGADSLALIGVENIGEPPFKVYGSLKAAYPDTGDNVTKILLSHNPNHWVDSIRGNDAMRIALTLSGHTHAMQMEVAGVSPAALRYSTWGGLYADDHEHHQLYVNIGAGTVGMPMRIGATPEITVITLRRRR